MPRIGLFKGGTRVSDKRDINFVEGSNITITATDDGNSTNIQFDAAAGGAPTTVDYLVGTTSGDLSAEIVVGTSPGGELGGTWGTPTVDTTHAGSPHSDYIAKSVADAAGDLLLASAADTWARLAIGNNNEVLTSNGTTASWQVVGAASHPAYASHAKFGVD